MTTSARSYAAPLSAVDKLETGPDGRTTAIKDIVATDPYLVGHYPHFTIYPGVFSIETVYQAARAALERDLLESSPDNAGKRVRWAGIHSVHFSAPLLPGDRLTAELTFKPSAADPCLIRVRAVARRADGQTTAKISLDLRVGGEPAAAAETGTEVVLEHADIKRILPHRHPILQVDRVLELVPGKRIVATKAIAGGELCYAGLEADADHAYPVSLLVESLGQAGGLLWLYSARLTGQPLTGTLILGNARDLELTGAAYPGDVLRHVVELDMVKGDNAFMRGETWVGARRIATVGSILAVLRPDSEL